MSETTHKNPLYASRLVGVFEMALARVPKKEDQTE
jgi:hypothetical protein